MSVSQILIQNFTTRWQLYESQLNSYLSYPSGASYEECLYFVSSPYTHMYDLYATCIGLAYGLLTTFL